MIQEYSLFYIGLLTLALMANVNAPTIETPIEKTMAESTNSTFTTAFATSAAATEVTNQPALTVTTVKPRSKTWPVAVTATGGLYAWQEAIIGAEVSGLRIVEVLGDVGQVVKKGDVLANLSQDTVAAALAQRRAEVAQAEVALAQAKADAARARKAKKALSEQQTEQYFFAQDRAQALVDAAKAVLNNEEIRLEKTHIYAVDDGIISSRSATLGAVVQSGNELFRLIRQNRIEWRAEVTDEQFSQIRINQSVRIELPDNKTVDGKVRVISPALDTKTRKALVYVDLSNDDLVRAGMFVRGEILIDNTKAVTLPVSAVVLRDGFNYLFVVKADDSVESRKVSIGRVRDDLVEIVTDLESKAVVVLTGGAFLEDGDKVRVVQSQSPSKSKSKYKSKSKSKYKSKYKSKG